MSCPNHLEEQGYELHCMLDEGHEGRCLVHLDSVELFVAAMKLEELTDYSTAEDERNKIMALVQSWIDAYPPEIFGEGTTKEEQQAHSFLITRNSAAMARHVASRLLSQIELM